MCSLPSDNQNIETPSAVALLGYIRNHFKNTCTTKLYILSALNGFENKPISKQLLANCLIYLTKIYIIKR